MSISLVNFLFKYIVIFILFFIPIRLSFTYALVIPTLLIIFCCDQRQLVEYYKKNELIRYFHLFLFIVLLSSLFGFNFFISLKSLASLFFFSFLILVLEKATKFYNPVHLILFLLLGQAFVGIHSIIESGLAVNFGRVFIGAVSESGQIALTFPIGVALAVTLLKKSSKSLLVGNPNLYLSLIATTILLSLVTYYYLFNLPKYVFWVGVGIVSFSWIYAAQDIFKFSYLNFNKKLDQIRLKQISFLLLVVLLPVIFFAFLANLKRGPWFGVFISLLVFFSIFRRKLLLMLCVVVPCLALSVTPVRNRITDSLSDFNISGGRNIMWQVGGELAVRYPLGIGFGNSAYQQKFANEIPLVHQHFHNNFINILVECGWISFMFFIYWLYKVFSLVFFKIKKTQYYYLQIGAGCSILAMFFAGLTEYNFGDSEVSLLMFAILGILSGILDTNKGECCDLK